MAQNIRGIRPPDLEPTVAKHLSLTAQVLDKDSSYSAYTLVDSGATSNFISIDFVRKYRLPVIRRHTPLGLANLNGTPFTKDGVFYYTAALELRIRGHREFISFNVVPLCKYTIVLGYPWLEKHNPNPDWRRRVLRFSDCPQDHFLDSRFPADSRHSACVATLTADEFYRSVEKDPNAICGAVTVPGPHTETTQVAKVPECYSRFHELFSKEAADVLPEHRPWDHTIPIDPRLEPPFGPLYALSATELKALREYLDENLSRGFIRPSSSPAGAPILFVKKKDGTLRLCVDYRGLNRITIKNRYALPLISELIDRFQGSRVFTRLDLRGAYNLVRIAAGEEWKTAFRTRYGHFEYLVMPFGLTNAPASFQDLVNSVLRPYLDRTCVVYLDDILIYSETEDEHVRHVSEILETLQKHNLFVKLEKCVFHQEEVEFLGYLVGKNGVRMDPAKVSAVAEWPEPKNVRDVQSFLGFANFYRRFIPDYSEKSLELTALLKKDRPFVWTPEAQKSFDTLKATFTRLEYGILRYYNPSLPSMLETDASDYAIGACISQRDPETQRLHPIAYYSRKMTPAECNYEIYDKEMLAIVEAFREFRVYLEGSPHQITVLTDHKNLEYFTTTKTLNRRQARWSEALGSFDFLITYRPGVSNTKADPLSRRTVDPRSGSPLSERCLLAPGPEPDQLLLAANLSSARAHSPCPDTEPRSENPPASFSSPAFEEKLRRCYEQDSSTARVLKDLSEGIYKENFSTNPTGLLLFRNRLYLPNNNALRVMALRIVHDSPIGGHQGITKTLELLHRHCFFPRMSRFVAEYVNTCDMCQRIKSAKHKPYGLLQPLPVPNRPWESVSMDFIVKLPKSRDSLVPDNPEYDSIWVTVDRLTKQGHFVPYLEATKAPRFAKLYVKHIFPIHGFPAEWITDRGKVFIAKFTESFCKLVRITPKPSTAHHPETDGQTERLNQILEQYLRAFCDYAQDNWVELLPLAQFAYNNAFQESIKTSPFYATYGYNPAFDGQLAITSAASPAAEEYVDYLKALHEVLKDEMRLAQERYKLAADRARLPAPQYQVGDEVWLTRKKLRTTRPTKKLDYKNLGPYRVVRSIRDHAYELDLPYNQKFHNVFHVSRLEPFKPDNLRGVVHRPPPVIIEGEGSDTESEAEEYEIESIETAAIRPHETTGVKEFHFLVRWKGYGPDFDTWEPFNHVQDAEAFDAFEAKHPDWEEWGPRPGGKKKGSKPPKNKKSTSRQEQSDSLANRASASALSRGTPRSNDRAVANPDHANSSNKRRPGRPRKIESALSRPSPPSGKPTPTHEALPLSVPTSHESSTPNSVSMPSPTSTLRRSARLKSRTN
jgi:hypothetical protein